MVSRADSDITYVVEKVLRVPDRHREFSESADDARRVYRIDQPLLARLLDLGLPCRGRGRDARFDALDLKNIVLSLHLPAPHYLMMRLLPAALTAVAAGTEVAYRIGIRSQCWNANACHSCAVEYSPVLDTADAVLDRTPQDPTIDIGMTVRVRYEVANIPAPFTELLDQLAPVEWHHLPTALAADISFLRDARLADCRLASKYLYEEAQRRELPARRSFGLIVTTPFSGTHQWTEFFVDGRWLPADPLFLTALAQWGFLDPAEWPPTRSPAGMLWQVGPEYVPIALHNGSPVRVTFPTKRIQ
jgi:hypothetical protein